jgi:biotin carboxylase
LIIAPNGSYRIAPYLEAARALGIGAAVVSQGASAVAMRDVPGIQIDFADAPRALDTIASFARQTQVHAVLGTDDASMRLAARVAALLGLPHNSAEAVEFARRKDHARRRLRDAGVPVPDFLRIDLDADLDAQALRAPYPCVLKPLALSASRGVIRADGPADFAAACRRIAPLLRDAADPEERRTLLAEAFIPGFEVAVEGLLTGGQLEMLAIFDKPDPLDGPYFEETYYITPTRLGAERQQLLHDTVEAACAAYGLREGPVHAECRINADGVWMLEVAARTIGGLCGRLLTFGTGYGLEELVLRHALGLPLDTARRDGGAGVLMIPIPQGGIFRRVEGLRDAERVEFIEEIAIQIREGHELTPWPEGASYLGFMFARAPTAELAEAALRRAHACLRIVTAALWRASVVTGQSVEKRE